MSKLYFRYGAMNCGKSTSLLQIDHNYHEQGMSTILIKPAIDTKEEDYIVSRLGAKKKVDLLVNEQDNIHQLIKGIADKYENLGCILIDEVQFLTREQINQLYEYAVLEDVPVMCFGLRTDFLNDGFEGSSRLLELAHSIQEIKNVCSCGRKATSTVRYNDGEITFSGNQILIDDNVQVVTYEAKCSKCYLEALRDFELKHFGYSYVGQSWHEKLDRNLDWAHVEPNVEEVEENFTDDLPVD